jgi:hypothetical protein
MSILSDNSHALWFVEWKSILAVLQENCRFTSNFSDDILVVSLNIDVPVDLAVAFVGLGVLVTEGFLAPRIEVGWYSDLVSADFGGVSYVSSSIDDMSTPL